MLKSAKRIVATTLAAGLLAYSTTAAAWETYPTSIVEGWSIRQYSDNHCAASFTYQNGTRLSVSAGRDHGLRVTFSQPRWSSVRSFTGTMTLTYVFLNQPNGAFKAAAVRSPDEATGLEARIGELDAQRFLSLWSTSSNLRVSQGEQALESVPLSGSLAAMTALTTCVRAAAQAEEERLERECETEFDRFNAELDLIESAEDELARDTSMWVSSRDALYASRKTPARLSAYEDGLQVDYLEAERKRLSQREADLKARGRSHNVRLDALEEKCG